VPGGHLSSPGLFQHIDGKINNNPMNPGTKPGFSSERVKPSEGSDKRFLHDLLGEMLVADEPKCNRVHLFHVHIHEPAKGMTAALLGLMEKHLLIVSSHRVVPGGWDLVVRHARREIG
jgi:hypothetical protein